MAETNEGRERVILSRNAYDGTPLQIVDINDETAVFKYLNKYYRTYVSWDRVDKGTYNQNVLIGDLPYIVVGEDVYPLRTFNLWISEPDYYYMILGDKIDYEVFEEGDMGN